MIRVTAFLLVLLIAVPGWGATTTISIAKNVNLALGQRDFGPFSLPDALTICTLSFDRTHWTNPSATISTQLEISLDGGVTWQFWLGMTASGDSVMTTIPTSMTRRLPV